MTKGNIESRYRKRSSGLPRRHAATIFAVAALLLFGLAPGAAHATTILLDPNIDPIAQGYTAHGGATVNVGGGLITINDPPNDHLYYTKAFEEISGVVRVRFTIGITPGILDAGTDTGVRFALDDGFKRVELRFVQVGAERRVGITQQTGNVSTGAAYDWATDGTLEFRREANGDAVLTIGGTDVETILAADLLDTYRNQPTFEFGAYSHDAQVSARFGTIQVAVPEPSTMLLLMIGLAGLFVFRRRQVIRG